MRSIIVAASYLFNNSFYLIFLSEHRRGIFFVLEHLASVTLKAISLFLTIYLKLHFRFGF